MNAPWRAVAATCLSALPLALAPSTAAADVTVGQLAPGGPPVSTPCSNAFELVQPTVTSGAEFVIPATGGVRAWTLTSWAHNASADPGQTIALRIFRKVAEPATFTVLGGDGPRPVVAGINTFATAIRVEAGDFVGLQVPNVDTACAFQVLGEQIRYFEGSLAIGASAPFELDGGARLNVSALLEPVNEFKLGKLVRNPEKGTATLTFKVPNAGRVGIAGKGVKGAAKAAKGEGKVKLRVRAKGEKRRILESTGRVKLKAKTSFTPSGGERSKRSTTVTLTKR